MTILDWLDWWLGELRRRMFSKERYGLPAYA